MYLASNLYWLTVGQGLLPLQQVGVEEDVFTSSVSCIHFPPSALSLFFLLLSLFSLSPGDDIN